MLEAPPVWIGLALVEVVAEDRPEAQPLAEGGGARVSRVSRDRGLPFAGVGRAIRRVCAGVCGGGVCGACGVGVCAGVVAGISREDVIANGSTHEEPAPAEGQGVEHDERCSATVSRWAHPSSSTRTRHPAKSGPVRRAAAGAA